MSIKADVEELRREYLNQKESMDENSQLTTVWFFCLIAFIKNLQAINVKFCLE